MIDLVIPKDNEAELVKMAEQLGYKGLVFAYKGKIVPDLSKIKTKLKLSQIEIQDPKKLHRGVNSLVKAEENSRPIIDFAPTIVYDFEVVQEKDTLHQRVSGLNQIMCKIAKAKGTMIAFNLQTIISLKGMKRALILGRIAQNIKLCRKYKNDVIIASFAKEPLEMRTPHDLQALFYTIGMTQGEAKKAMESLNKL